MRQWLVDSRAAVAFGEWGNLEISCKGSSVFKTGAFEYFSDAYIKQPDFWRDVLLPVDAGRNSWMRENIE